MTLGGAVSLVLAASSIPLSLPATSRPAMIGSVSLHLIDDARSLALMVTLWYPARPSSAPATAYLDDGVARSTPNEPTS